MTETTPATADERYLDAIKSLVRAVVEAEKAKRKLQAENARRWARALDLLATSLDDE